MLNPRHSALFLTAVAVLLAAPAALGVCTPSAQPCPTPMYYPGEVLVGPGCCPGPCACIPKIDTWGHYQRRWATWPGDENRVGRTFPDSRGREVIGTPKGVKPEPLPKEEYTTTPTQTGPGIDISEGATTAPVETPPPFDFGRGLEGLPGLDLPPEGPGPETPSTEGVPEGGGLPGLPPIQDNTTPSIPPAPGPNETTAAPATPLREADDLYITAQSLAAELPAEPAAPMAPLPTQGDVLQTSAATLPTMNATPPPEATAAAGPSPAIHTAQAPAAPPIASQPELSPAPLPDDAAPLPSEAASPRTAEQAPGAWKSRREHDRPADARAVGYEEAVGPATVGLDGFCPVDLIRNERWTEGDPRWTARHDGRIYHLSGPMQHRMFRANPERYAPALAGCDPVIACTGGRTVAGRTDACVIFQGRLLMFSSKASLAKFRQEPARFMESLRELEQ